MIRVFTALAVLAVLTACGGSGGYGRGAIPFATGPVYSACIDSGRKAATRGLCGCVQAVADNKLSRRQQARAAEFHAEPLLSQDARENGSRRFWNAYKSYAKQAEQTCARA